MKKIVAMLLAVLVVLSVCACAPAGNEPASPSGTNPVETNPVETNPSVSATDPVEELSYPIEGAPALTLWFSGGLLFDPEDTAELPFTQGLKENTGVTVEYLKPIAGSSAKEAYNLLLTESKENLPNIIYHNVTAAQGEELLMDDFIYDLTDYLPKYAPDYWEFITSHEGLLNNLVTASGRVYAIHSLQEGAYNATFVGPVVRKDWLDECGLGVPVTMQDWEDVMIAFKEKYGVAMAFSTNRFLDQAGLASGTDAYATMNPTLYVDDNGQLQLAQAQPEWKEYMQWLNKWYEMGLIDMDSLTMDDAAVRTKAANNEFGIGFTAMSQLTLFVNDAATAGSTAEWIGIEYPRTAAGEATSMIQQNILYKNARCAVITKSCSEEQLIAALKFLNYGYSEEGILYWNFGDEGVSFTMGADGVPQWTTLVTEDPDGLSKGVDKYSCARNAGLTVQMGAFVQSINSEQAGEAVYKWIENTEADKHILPSLALTADESAEYSDIMNAINARVKEMCLKFITGDESLDKFDDYVAELKSMGLDDALAIQQDAYERWNNT